MVVLYQIKDPHFISQLFLSDRHIQHNTRLRVRLSVWFGFNQAKKVCFQSMMTNFLTKHFFILTFMIQVK